MIEFFKKIFFYKAQASIELAVFGAIIVFVLGLIVRQAFNTAFFQNRHLNALRKAFSLSMETARQEYPASTISPDYGEFPFIFPMGVKGVGARNSASVMIIEDRLTPSASKYGPLQRVPFISQGGGTFSQNLYLPVDGHEDWNLPRFDLIVNGQHFVLSLSGFRHLYGLNEIQDPNKNDRYPEIEWMDQCVHRPAYDVYETKPYNSSAVCPCSEGCAACDAPPCYCNNFLRREPEQMLGCRIFYKRVPNLVDHAETSYCAQDCDFYVPRSGFDCGSYPQDLCYMNAPGSAKINGNETKPCCDKYKNLTADERFDLDRDGNTDITTQEDRDNFSWQWIQIKGIDRVIGNKNRDHVVGGAPYCCSTTPGTVYPVGSAGGATSCTGCDRPITDNFIDPNAPEYIDSWRKELPGNNPIPHAWTPYLSLGKHSKHHGGYLFVPYSEGVRRSDEESTNLVVDVDGDRQEETIISYTINEARVIENLTYMDSDAGDVDFSTYTFNDKDEKKPGLLPEQQMFSVTRDGTYLQLDQGNWIDPSTKGVVRSVQKRDRVDFVQRVFQLTNDTGHLCGNGTPVDPSQPRGPGNGLVRWDAEPSVPNKKQNPYVEACACQFGSGNFYIYDPANPPGPNWNNCGSGPDTYDSCFEAGSIDKTCFDEDTYKLYIRTRLENKGGRKWLQIFR